MRRSRKRGRKLVTSSHIGGKRRHRNSELRTKTFTTVTVRLSDDDLRMKETKRATAPPPARRYRPYRLLFAVSLSFPSLPNVQLFHSCGITFLLQPKAIRWDKAGPVTNFDPYCPRYQISVLPLRGMATFVARRLTLPRSL